ncbi:MAG: peptide deformylase [Planctomycetes bacterium]|nr:peptide deformylase [Planctomycetota bacterium]
MLPQKMRLRYYPDPVLRQRAEAIESIDDAVRQGARAMLRIMYDHGGIGLAGPQVGWSKRIFVANLAGAADKPEEELVFINPVVTAPGEEAVLEEGCLSFPDVRIEIVRADRVHIAALNLAGERFEMDASEMLARCVQHEVDHLDGILFISRISLAARMAIRGKLKDLERKYKESKEAG